MISLAWYAIAMMGLWEGTIIWYRLTPPGRERWYIVAASIAATYLLAPLAARCARQRPRGDTSDVRGCQ